jgi:hypothetical protein
LHRHVPARSAPLPSFQPNPSRSIHSLPIRSQSDPTASALDLLAIAAQQSRSPSSSFMPPIAYQPSSTCPSPRSNPVLVSSPESIKRRRIAAEGDEDELPTAISVIGSDNKHVDEFRFSAAAPRKQRLSSISSSSSGSSSSVVPTIANSTRRSSSSALTLSGKPKKPRIGRGLDLEKTRASPTTLQSPSLDTMTDSIM